MAVIKAIFIIILVLFLIALVAVLLLNRSIKKLTGIDIIALLRGKGFSGNMGNGFNPNAGNNNAASGSQTREPGMPEGKIFSKDEGEYIDFEETKEE
jgi:hypothetical protein